MLCCSSAQVLWKMQAHQECPPWRITPLECTLANNAPTSSLECPVTNSLDLKSPGIRASWLFRGAEVLWRSATAVTSLECTDTKNGLASPVECTDTNSLDLKCFRFHSYKKRWGGGGVPAAMLRQNVKASRGTCPGARVAALPFLSLKAPAAWRTLPRLIFSPLWHPMCSIQ